MTTLRDYQSRALEEARRYLSHGKRSPLIVAPTGAGKTTLASEVARGRVARGGRVVWLAHRRELIRQGAETLRRFGLDVGAEGLGASAPVQVCSVQALLARGQAPEADLVIFDEAHHFAADQWSRLAVAYKDAWKIGLSATPVRSDGRGLGDIFDCIVVASSVRELTERGYLVPAEVVHPGAEMRSGKRIAMSPLDAYRSLAPGLRAVVFAPNVKSARQFADEFVAAGIVAECVEGKMSAGDRDDALSRFKSGRTRVLCNVAILTEGWDCPAADCAILARKVGSLGLYIQIVGRVLRPHPGKRRALVIDLNDNARTHGAPDEDRSYDLEDGIVSRAGKEAKPDPKCRVCGYCFDGDAAEACPDCGTLRSRIYVPTVKPTEMEKYAGARAEGMDQRMAWFERQRAIAAMKGYKPGWAAYRFKTRYGHWPAGAR